MPRSLSPPRAASFLVLVAAGCVGLRAQGIDAFVSAELARRGIEPAPAAEPMVWLRRVALDLTGLPPTPDEVAIFLADPSPSGRESAVDRLLASPRYGEHWATWWLDLARYADSQGYEKDQLRPTMWRYRDWVVDALQRDMPFDRFTIEQLAGDLLENATAEQRLATAFHRNTMTNTEGGTDDEEFRVAAVTDRVDTTMAVWMGATMGCARCHDHKYDPLTQKEYYELFAFFDQTEDCDRADDKPVLRVPTRRQSERAALLRAEQAKLRSGVRPGRPAPMAVRKRLRQIEVELAGLAGPAVPVMRELPPDKRRETHLLRRGSFLTPGEVVEPGTPACWPPMPAGWPRNRLGLARWLVSADNPRTARVIANRLWAELFGRGLVPTLEDFGSQGEPCSHPALLDWLGGEFVRGGWSIKHLLRTIVLSETYGRSSNVRPGDLERDRYNVWLARGPAFRLSAEMLRDQALSVSGLLSEKRGGPSVMPPQPDGVWMQIYSSASWVESEGEDRYRRALYTFWRRTSPHPLAMVFDAQSRESCVLRRTRTNTPLQALALWNAPQFTEPARALAELACGAADGDRSRIEWMWRRCLLRAPTESEVDRVIALLAEERTAGVGEGDAWSLIASVLMNLDEFVTKR